MKLVNSLQVGAAAILVALALSPQISALPLQADVALCERLGCEIELTHVARLSSPENQSSMPDYHAPVFRDNFGHFVTLSAERSGFLIFDQSGRYLRTAGSEGGGAARLGRLVAAGLFPDGRIWAYDARMSLLSILSADFKVTSSSTFPSVPKFAISPTQFIVADQLRTRDSVGYPIHIITQEGSILHSFGADQPQFRPDLAPIVNRVVGPGRGSSLWAVAPGNYLIEKWDSATRRRLSWAAVKTSWFQASQRSQTDVRLRPVSLVEGVWEADGLVWTLIRTADTKWQPPPDASDNKERPWSADSYYKTYDWILEAINPTTGDVMASTRFGAGRWASGVLMISQVTGSLRGLDVWAPRLVQRRKL